ncbi:uncharacterized protein [Miscanthus floridulus]|uniref:uncharacterized protein n=1 Tax=Miscanthus floridulus TaxID=154761 RepID=UPI00345ADD6B
MAGNVVVVEADPWDPSDVTEEMLQSLVDGGLLRPVTDSSRPEWIAPYGELEPRPRDDYVVSFVSFHERGLSVPAGRFMRALIAGGGGGGAAGPAEGRRGAGVRRGPSSADGYGCDATAAASAVAEEASPGSSAHWVAEAQAAIQRGAASARVNPQEPAAQGRVAEAAPKWSDGAIVPFVAEAPGASRAEAMGAPAPMTAEIAVSAAGASVSAEAIMTEAGAPETAEAVIVEAGAPEVTMAVVTAARPSVQEVEM